MKLIAKMFLCLINLFVSVDSYSDEVNSSDSCDVTI